MSSTTPNRTWEESKAHFREALAKEKAAFKKKFHEFECPRAENPDDECDCGGIYEELEAKKSETTPIHVWWNEGITQRSSWSIIHRAKSLEAGRTLCGVSFTRGTNNWARVFEGEPAHDNFCKRCNPERAREIRVAIEGLTAAQLNLYQDVLADRVRVYNGRARTRVKALEAAGLVRVEWDMRPQAKGNGMELVEKIVVRVK